MIYIFFFKKVKQQEERPPDKIDYFYRIYMFIVLLKRKMVTNTNKVTITLVLTKIS